MQFMLKFPIQLLKKLAKKMLHYIMNFSDFNNIDGIILFWNFTVFRNNDRFKT